MEREAFLETVAAARAGARLPGPSSRAGGAALPDLAPADLAELFAERLTSIDGEVHRVLAADAAYGIASLLRRHEGTDFLAWDEEAIGVPGLFALLTAEGRRRVSGAVPDDAAGRLVHQTGYRDLGSGITGADAGLAESGSLVLVSGPGRPRMASLIPPVHVAVLRTSQIVRTLPHLVASRPELAGAGSNFVVITGPSRTADIEMSLTLGVHGPRHVHVVLVDD